MIYKLYSWFGFRNDSGKGEDEEQARSLTIEEWAQQQDRRSLQRELRDAEDDAKNAMEAESEYKREHLANLIKGAMSDSPMVRTRAAVNAWSANQKARLSRIAHKMNIAKIANTAKAEQAVEIGEMLDELDQDIRTDDPLTPAALQDRADDLVDEIDAIFSEVEGDLDSMFRVGDLPELDVEETKIIQQMAAEMEGDAESPADVIAEMNIDPKSYNDTRDVKAALGQMDVDVDSMHERMSGSTGTRDFGDFFGAESSATQSEAPNADSDEMQAMLQRLMANEGGEGKSATSD